MALTILVTSMAAYALSRLRFRGQNVVFILILGGIMVPAQVLIVPIFQELNALGLLNTYWAVIFPQVPAVIAVFVFKQFFDGLPARLRGVRAPRRCRVLDDLPVDPAAVVQAGDRGHVDRHVRRGLELT